MSFVPKLKNSAISAISSAVIAALGTSIIVPIVYFILSCFFSKISDIAFSSSCLIILSSSFVEISGIIISGSIFIPFDFTSSAASIIAVACII